MKFLPSFRLRSLGLGR
ncbi:unnamed protein product, partial [Rotaria magnacalcarata]